MMKTTQLFAYLLSVSVALAASERAMAQPDSTAETDANKRASAAYQTGVRLFKERKWAEAEDAFAAAWALVRTPDVAFNLGSTKHHLGKHRAAAELLANALRNWPLTKALESYKPVLEQRLRESRAFVGTLHLQVDPANAEIWIDGAPIDRSLTSSEVFVEPGTHVVEAKLEGYSDAKETVSASKGEVKEVRLSLSRAVASGPISAPPPPPIVPHRSSAVSPWYFVVGGGLAVTGVALGTGFTVAANSQGSDADRQLASMSPNRCYGASDSACRQLLDARKNHDSYTNAAVGSFVAGGVFALATAGLWTLAGHDTARAGALQVTPVVGWRDGGIVFQGHF